MSKRTPQQSKGRGRGAVTPLYLAVAVLITVAVVGSLIYLSTPRPAQIQQLSGIPSRDAELGLEGAKVTITEYSDFR